VVPGAEAVYFDVDGTLVDTNYLHTAAWWHALSDFGISATMAQVHRLIGRSGEDLLAELAGGVDERISRAHGEHFARQSHLIRPLPGAWDLLRHVNERGQSVVIVTSAKKDELRILLAPLDCDDVIDDVVHGETVESSKPAPDLFQAALERTGIEPANGVALGDTGWDVEAAQRAGLPCVAVETGGVARCELMTAGAAAVYPSCADLLGDYESSPLATPACARNGPAS
jgi:HAD superfamily hydrolase (TIGR01509 family)